MVRSLISGTHWPQARLHGHGRAVSDKCRICGCRGTLFHRGFDCPCSAGFRRTDMPVDLRQAARKVAKLGEDEAELFARCIFLAPERCFGRPEAPEENWVRFVGAMPGWLWRGPIFVDGPAYCTKHGSCRRAGWSAVQVDQAGRFVACMYGVWGSPSRMGSRPVGSRRRRLCIPHACTLL